MKLHIISADGRGQIDPTMHRSILLQIPGMTSSLQDADAVIVPVSHFQDYTFNSRLREIRVPVILLDMMEYYGRSSAVETHFFGVNHDAAINISHSDEWRHFHEWVRENPPVLYFKRELLSADVSDRRIPIEWPCVLPAWQEEPKVNFDTRPFEVFYNWGYSNGLRPRLAGEILCLMADGKIEVVSSFDHVDAAMHKSNRRWISIHSPHTHRAHIDQIMLRQAQSKMSVSMPGAGVKCFRSAEHIVHTVPVKLKDELAWSFPWIHGENCLEMQPGDMGGQLDEFTRRSDLHSIYLGSRELADRYREGRYVSGYIMPNIIMRL